MDLLDFGARATRGALGMARGYTGERSWATVENRSELRDYILRTWGAEGVRLYNGENVQAELGGDSDWARRCWI